jgi:hypothetical protein
MSNRLTATALAFTAVLGLIAATSAQQGSKEPHDHAYDHCARACNDCELICNACATHCAHLVAEGKKDHLRTMRTCQDCATHCAVAAKITASKGPFSDLICTACAEACKRCGEACDQHKDDPMMKKCADECRKCEKACRDMLQHIKK